jgi:hypothetical protein
MLNIKYTLNIPVIPQNPKVSLTTKIVTGLSLKFAPQI